VNRKKKTFIDEICVDNGAFYKMLANIDLKKSEAWSKDDLARIKEVAEKEVGFIALNKMVKEKMREWVDLTLKTFSSDSGQHSDEEDALRKKMAYATNLHQTGQFEKSFELYQQCLTGYVALYGTPTHPKLDSLYTKLSMVCSSLQKKELERDYLLKLSTSKGHFDNIQKGSMMDCLLYSSKVAPLLLRIYFLIENLIENEHFDFWDFTFDFIQGLGLGLAELLSLSVKWDMSHEGTFEKGLSHFLFIFGMYELGVAFYSRALDAQQAVHGPNHIILANTYTSMGLLFYARLGMPEQALGCISKALAIQLDSLGPDHLDNCILYNFLGDSYTQQGKYELAREYHTKSLTIRRAIFDPDNDDFILTIHEKLAKAYELQGDYDLALEHLEKIRDIRPTACHSISCIYFKQGLYSKAFNFIWKSHELQYISKNGVPNSSYRPGLLYYYESGLVLWTVASESYVLYALFCSILCYLLYLPLTSSWAEMFATIYCIYAVFKIEKLAFVYNDRIFGAGILIKLAISCSLLFPSILPTLLPGDWTWIYQIIEHQLIGVIIFLKIVVAYVFKDAENTDSEESNIIKLSLVWYYLLYLMLTFICYLLYLTITVPRAWAWAWVLRIICHIVACFPNSPFWKVLDFFFDKIPFGLKKYVVFAVLCCLAYQTSSALSDDYIGVFDSVYFLCETWSTITLFQFYDDCTFGNGKYIRGYFITYLNFFSISSLWACSYLQLYLESQTGYWAWTIGFFYQIVALCAHPFMNYMCMNVWFVGKYIAFATLCCLAYQACVILSDNFTSGVFESIYCLWTTWSTIAMLKIYDDCDFGAGKYIQVHLINYLNYILLSCLWDVYSYLQLYLESQTGYWAWTIGFIYRFIAQFFGVSGLVRKCCKNYWFGHYIVFALLCNYFGLTYSIFLSDDSTSSMAGAICSCFGKCYEYICVKILSETYCPYTFRKPIELLKWELEVIQYYFLWSCIWASGVWVLSSFFHLFTMWSAVVLLVLVFFVVPLLVALVRVIKKRRAI
jgi:tetratricopeptide (TPR) repeat protein